MIVQLSAKTIVPVVVILQQDFVFLSVVKVGNICEPFITDWLDAISYNAYNYSPPQAAWLILVKYNMCSP